MYIKKLLKIILIEIDLCLIENNSSFILEYYFLETCSKIMVAWLYDVKLCFSQNSQQMK